MRPSVMQRNLDDYRALGRMSEKEVQLALLMKRVKEQYITQEQALEMAKVLHLEVNFLLRNFIFISKL